MPALRLVYFDFKGRAEPIRLALAIGNIPFEDHRFKREEWPALKATMPFQAVPVLEVDGKRIAQSLAILRYVGGLTGLVPADPVMAARVDEIVLGIELELTSAISPTMRMSDEAQKMAARKVLAEETLPRHLANLEKLVGQESEWAVGDSITIADVMLYQSGGWLSSGILDGIPKSIMDPYPKMKKIIEKVHSHPRVAEWNAAHP